MQLAFDAGNRFHHVLQTILELLHFVEKSPQSVFCTYIFAQKMDSLAQNPFDEKPSLTLEWKRCSSKSQERSNHRVYELLVLVADQTQF